MFPPKGGTRVHALEVEISSVARSKLLWLLVLSQFFKLWDVPGLLIRTPWAVHLTSPRLWFAHVHHQLASATLYNSCGLLLCKLKDAIAGLSSRVATCTLGLTAVSSKQSIEPPAQLAMMKAFSFHWPQTASWSVISKMGSKTTTTLCSPPLQHIQP